MLRSIEFENFRVLRKARLELQPFTLLVGPNGSGKSTVLSSLELLRYCLSDPKNRRPQLFHDPGAKQSPPEPAQVRSVAARSNESVAVRIFWTANGDASATLSQDAGWTASATGKADRYLRSALDGMRRFSLDPKELAKPAQIQAGAALATTGFGLPAVLDRLQSTEPERWEALNLELGRCIPEFDRIVADVHPQPGTKAIWLRSRSHHRRRFSADEISSGTLIALALLTLAYLPDPPAIICLEEPDHGIHPRLLKDVRDALFRLCYPDQFGESREPVQIIATTHSPYFLDLFRDRPEEIVIANKQGHEATFERLIDRPNYQQILGDAPLGEVWYSGILGGVPTHT